jgi:hypothetical protein
MKYSYKVARATSEKGLEKAAETLLEAGYEPVGGIAVAWEDGYRTLTYVQAFIKKETTDKTES